ncbi:hypothetical protein BDZ85DRAFT_137142 [Elsinoe ampelina]|uniref:Uncharacterized protein n=1 Tax=Elsinoe ampelina TaxID=302913 RepID=A0A6A6G9P7_9PEZI|nr:hypothetical protein BDZ85DRAFT_137142 [Elsinoe ampelina]
MSAPSPERTSYDSSRRRSSGAMFASLSQYKRNPDNQAYQQRRQSLTETGQKPGFIGSMFNKYVRQANPLDK